MDNAWPEGYDRIILDAVDSTNSEARRRAEAGERGPLWVGSPHQLSGRGRDGRRWLTEPGNLAATLLRPLPPGGMARAATLAFTAGLAVADMLQQECGLSATLKWPNDALVDGRKVAGVLIEGMRNTVAVGIGINLRHAPPAEEGAWQAVSVHEAAGVTPAFETAFRALAASWAVRYRQWDRGFAEIREAWLARAAFLGEPITARLPGEVCHGIFEGIASDGAMILATPGGRRRLGSAEVFRS